MIKMISQLMTSDLRKEMGKYSVFFKGLENRSLIMLECVYGQPKLVFLGVGQRVQE